MSEWMFIDDTKWRRRDGLEVRRSSERGLWGAWFAGDGSRPVMTAAGEPAEATAAEVLMRACDRGDLPNVLPIVES